VAYLLDSSAVLAVLFGERGADTVIPLLEQSSIHAIQIAEVVKKLRDRGVPDDTADRLIAELALPVLESFTAEDALRSRRYCLKGLSLGDRVCLLVADRAGLTAVTAEHRWKEVRDGDVSLRVKILLIHTKSH
jgi:ribonuclease VapC